MKYNDLKYVKNTRTMAENESHDVPDEVKKYAIDVRKRSEIVLQKLRTNAANSNVRALTEYNGVCPILIDGINLILTKISIYMKEHGIKKLEDVKGFNYIPELNCYSLDLSMDKWLNEMLGDYKHRAAYFKRECDKLAKSGNKVIWSREKKLDANGNVMLDENGQPIETLNVTYGQAIQVVFHGELETSIKKEASRMAAGGNIDKYTMEAATAKVLTTAKNLSSSSRANGGDKQLLLPKERVVTLFNKTLFQGIFDDSVQGFAKSVFFTTPHLQLKLMDGIETALSHNVFGKFMNGYLNQKEFRLNANMARQILLYIYQHDNGNDFVKYDIYDMAKAAFPSMIDSSKGRYISKKDALTMRWCIFKVCIIYSIMLCKGLLDGNAMTPVYDMNRISYNEGENTIRLVHSNSKENYSFTLEQKNDLEKQLQAKLGMDVLQPLLENIT